MSGGRSWNWSDVARRIRVPAGFAFAALYLWLAQPTWGWLGLGTAVAAPGLLLRALAAGHIRKDTELTTSGPYRYTRNPLYLGSLIIAAGFAVAARSGWVATAAAALFAAVYWPVMMAEERRLRERFPTYDDYARRVPRLLPGLRPILCPAAGSGPAFSGALYRKHREYNALLGAAAMLAALAAKIHWGAR